MARAVVTVTVDESTDGWEGHTEQLVVRGVLRSVLAALPSMAIDAAEATRAHYAEKYRREAIRERCFTQVVPQRSEPKVKRRD